MLECKTIELRDKGTYIPCVAILMYPSFSTTMDDRRLMRRSGYALDSPPLVLFGRMDGNSRKFPYDPFEWGDRTFHVAHKYVQDNWDTIESGQVVDVEFILGETSKPKEPEV